MYCPCELYYICGWSVLHLWVSIHLWVAITFEGATGPHWTPCNAVKYDLSIMTETISTDQCVMTEAEAFGYEFKQIAK